MELFLSAIIIILIIERFIDKKEHRKDIENLITALLSKNSGEYITTRKLLDEEGNEKGFIKEDVKDITELTDEEFMKITKND